MGLNKQKGNMYGFVTHTYCPIKGPCEFQCKYCYMIGKSCSQLKIEPKELRANLRKDNFIFVGSNIDMFAPSIPGGWIEEVLQYMKCFENTYLLQSKNPLRMAYFIDKAPNKSIFCTTIESDKDHPGIGKAPDMVYRKMGIKNIKLAGYRVMVTIEPIMDFDILELSSFLISLKPEQVNIGANSGRIKLPEPPAAKVLKLIENLERQKITVFQQENLKRILDQK